MDSVYTDQSYAARMAELQRYWSEREAREKKIEDHLNSIRLSNEEKLIAKHISLFTEAKEKELDLERKVQERLLDLRISNSAEDLENYKAQVDAKYKIEAERAKRSKTKRGKALSDDEIKAIDQKYNEMAKREKRLLDDNYKNRAKLEGKLKATLQKEQDRQLKLQAEADGEKYISSFSANLFGKGKTLTERASAVKSAFTQDTSTGKSILAGLATMTNAISDMAKQLNQKIDQISGYRTEVDTRLQGSNNATRFGSYWDQITKDFNAVGALSPFVKQEELTNKVREMINSGISFNVEQRAFLATIAGSIATTFNAADGTLLRLIRLQQQDSTAARLGMESSLTAFLNNLYESTEYLSNSISTSVRSALGEAQALMSTTGAMELEYQAQKWLGSLYSVGMSSEAVTGIANALGKLASGDISGVTNGGYGNLLLMAANASNQNVAQILADGLDASKTNVLLEAAVSYLAKLYKESSGSKILQQQFANIYGLTASDLKAAANLAGTNNTTLNTISNSNITYSAAMSRLNEMASTMYKRFSIGGMMSNLWDNFQYTMASGIANNPVLYATYKTATLLDDVVGGIALPDIKVLGTGVNLQTTIADLMRVGALSGSILNGIGSMISGLATGVKNTKDANGGSFLLNMMGINKGMTTLTRGGGNVDTTVSGASVSQSGFIGNAAGGDVYNKTMTDANDSAKSQLAQAQADTKEDVRREVVNNNIIQIVNILKDVIAGSTRLHVTMDDSSSWN